MSGCTARSSTLYTSVFPKCVALLFAVSLSAACSNPITADSATANTGLQTPDDALFLTIELEVDPARMDEFLAIMAKAAPDTRAFDGCQLFDIYVDQTNPGRVLFYEIWDSKEQQQAYSQWRTDTKFRDQIGHLLTGGKPPSFFTKFTG